MGTSTPTLTMNCKHVVNTMRNKTNKKLSWRQQPCISWSEAEAVQHAVLEHYRQVLDHLKVKLLPFDMAPQAQVSAYHTPNSYGIRFHCAANQLGFLAAEVVLGYRGYGGSDEEEWGLKTSEGVSCHAVAWDISVEDAASIDKPYGVIESDWIQGVGCWPAVLTVSTEHQISSAVHGSRNVSFAKRLTKTSSGVLRFSGLKNPKLIANDLYALMAPLAYQTLRGSLASNLADDASVFQCLQNIVDAAPDLVSIEFGTDSSTRESIHTITTIFSSMLYNYDQWRLNISPMLKVLGREVATDRIAAFQFAERVWTPVNTKEFLQREQGNFETLFRDELAAVLGAPASKLQALKLKPSEEVDLQIFHDFPSLSHTGLSALRRIFANASFVSRHGIELYGYRYFISEQDAGDDLLYRYARPQWMLAQHRNLRRVCERFQTLSWDDDIPTELLEKVVPHGFTLNRVVGSETSEKVYVFCHRNNMHAHLHRQGFGTTDAAINGAIHHVVEFFFPEKEEVKENQS